MTIAAEYTNGSKNRSATVAITQIAFGRRVYLVERKVSGKREARAVAKEFNAQPWNF